MEKLESNSEEIKGIKSDLGERITTSSNDIKTELQSVSKKINEHEISINGVIKELADQKERIRCLEEHSHNPVPCSPTTSRTRTTVGEDSQRKEFQTSLRSIRFYPIDKENRNNLSAAAKSFMMKSLKMEEDDIEMLGIAAITICPRSIAKPIGGDKTKIQVKVTSKTIEGKNFVFSHSKNLTTNLTN